MRSFPICHELVIPRRSDRHAIAVEFVGCDPVLWRRPVITRMRSSVLPSFARSGSTNEDLRTRRHRPVVFYHRVRLTIETSIVKLSERGTLMEGDMIRLAAPDLVLRIVCARMVSIAFDLEFTSMHAYDRAVDTPSLGIPAYAIMDLEGLRHGRSIRCRPRTAKEAVLVLGERHEHSNWCPACRFLEIAAFWVPASETLL